MSAYHMRKSATLNLGQLQRKSRHEAAKEAMGLPTKAGAARTTAPLSLSSKNTQSTALPTQTATRITTPLPSSQKAMGGADLLLPRTRAVPNHASRASGNMNPPEIFPPPSSGRNSAAENKHIISFQDHIIRITLGIWNLYKDTPPGLRLICIFIGIFLFMVLSFIVNVMMQIIAPFMNLICIIGFIASIIAIHEYLNKRNRSDTQ